MNTVQLIGRLTKDVTYNAGSGENGGVSRYTLAVNRDFKNKEGNYDADFISCVCFGKTAEFANKYLAKGTQIAVEGRIQTGSYENKEGQKVYTTDVVVNKHTLLGKKEGSASGSNTSTTSSDIPVGFEPIEESDLPF